MADATKKRPRKPKTNTTGRSGAGRPRMANALYTGEGVGFPMQMPYAIHAELRQMAAQYDISMREIVCRSTQRMLTDWRNGTLTEL